MVMSRNLAVADFASCGQSVRKSTGISTQRSGSNGHLIGKTEIISDWRVYCHFFGNAVRVSHTKFVGQLANSNHLIKSRGVYDQRSKYSNALGRFQIITMIYVEIEYISIFDSRVASILWRTIGAKIQLLNFLLVRLAFDVVVLQFVLTSAIQHSSLQFLYSN